jgi:hypothetical protein
MVYFDKNYPITNLPWMPVEDKKNVHSVSRSTENLSLCFIVPSCEYYWFKVQDSQLCVSGALKKGRVLRVLLLWLDSFIRTRTIMIYPLRGVSFLKLVPVMGHLFGLERGAPSRKSAKLINHQDVTICLRAFPFRKVSGFYNLIDFFLAVLPLYIAHVVLL